MNKSRYDRMKLFLAEICPRPNNYCNGQHIPAIKFRRSWDGHQSFTGENISRTKDLGRCQYHDGGCKHPRCPGNTERIGSRGR